MKHLTGIKHFDKLIEIASIIEATHAFDFKVSDYLGKDALRNAREAGLISRLYVDFGERNVKGSTRKASKTCMVYSFWMMMLMDLKTFGVKNAELHKIKAYLFKQYDIAGFLGVDTEQENLMLLLDSFSYEDSDQKERLAEKIASGKFLSSIKGRSVSHLFLMIFRMLSTGRDIQLLIDLNGEALFVDDFEFSEEELNRLTYDARIILPLKKYLLFFVGEYATDEFLTRSKILSPKEALILKELKRNDIVSMTVKYHNGKPNTFESKRLEKVELQARLSEVLLKGGYEDIILKTQKGNIFYSEITTKTKL